MLPNTEEGFDEIFLALSDPTRRLIIKRLSQHDHTIMELAKPFSISLPGLSKHIKVLERAKIITKNKKGREYFCTLNSSPLLKAMKLISEYGETSQQVKPSPKLNSNIKKSDKKKQVPK